MSRMKEHAGFQHVGKLETFYADGITYDAPKDKARLGKQMLAVWNVMVDGRWRTLRDISYLSDCPEASASARLRDFRKPRFGSHEVERRRRPWPNDGTWEYRLLENKK